MANGNIKNNLFHKTYTRTLDGSFCEIPNIDGYIPISAISLTNGIISTVAYIHVNNTNYAQFRFWNGNYPDSALAGQSVTFIVCYVKE